MKIFVTKDFYNERAAQLKQLRHELEHVRTEKHTAYSDDTNSWHDNFAYESLTRQEKQLETQLYTAMCDFDNYVVVASDTVVFDDAVGMFCRVKFLSEDVATGAETEKTISIVPLGGEDYKNMIYNYNAPSVLPLMGCRSGDVRTIKIPMGTFNITIIGVERL